MTQEQRIFFERLQSDHVITANATLIPLSGGVSSDIYRIVDGCRSFVIKRALPALRVRDEWLADVSRNEFEQRYLRYVGELLPDSVPKILSCGNGYFAMEFLGDEFVNWKAELLAGTGSVEHAAIAGRTLGAVHAASQVDPRAMQEFDSDTNFAQLRIDPYFRTIARRFPELAPLVEAEAARLLATHECLVHGDFSPKNILFCGGRMVVLDCEVAWYGDPAFDLAFCMSHLLLKGLYHAPKDIGVADMLEALVREYFSSYAVTTSRCQELELRTGRLLLLLLAARVDGKSPVEYLDPIRQQLVRDFALTTLRSGGLSSSREVCSQWLSTLAKAKLSS